MDKTRFLEWLRVNNCRVKEIREYVIEFYSSKLENRLKRSVTLSYNTRLDIYHVTDDFTGNDLYCGNFDALERLFKLSDINHIDDAYFDDKEYDKLLYDLHIAYKYGWWYNGKGGGYRKIKTLKCIGNKG